MGDWFQKIVDRDVPVSKAKSSARGIRSWLIEESVIKPRQTDCVLSKTGLGYPPGTDVWKAIGRPVAPVFSLAVNGVDIIIGNREVFLAGGTGYNLTCLKCQRHLDYEVFGERLFEAIGEWSQGQGNGTVACPECGFAQPVAEWVFDPAIGFGNLGFTFWNWPPCARLPQTSWN